MDSAEGGPAGGSAQGVGSEAGANEAQRMSQDKCRERNRLHARRSRQRKKAAQAGMVATLERRLDEMRRYDAVMLSHTGQPYQSHLEAEGRCTNLTTVRQGVEAAGDDIAGPGADDDPAPMQAGASTEDRAARSRERNRLHARRSRQRKKLLMESLKEQCDACSRDIAAIRSMLAARLGPTHADLLAADAYCRELARVPIETAEGTIDAAGSWSPAGSMRGSRRGSEGACSALGSSMTKRTRSQRSSDADEDTQEEDPSSQCSAKRACLRPRRAAACRSRAAGSTAPDQGSQDSDTANITTGTASPGVPMHPTSPGFAGNAPKMEPGADPGTFPAMHPGHPSMPRVDGHPGHAAFGARPGYVQHGGYTETSQAAPAPTASAFAAGPFGFLPNPAAARAGVDTKPGDRQDHAQRQLHARATAGWSAAPPAVSADAASAGQRVLPPSTTAASLAAPALDESEAAHCLMALVRGCSALPPASIPPSFQRAASAPSMPDNGHAHAWSAPQQPRTASFAYGSEQHHFQHGMMPHPAHALGQYHGAMHAAEPVTYHTPPRPGQHFAEYPPPAVAQLPQQRLLAAPPQHMHHHPAALGEVPLASSVDVAMARTGEMLEAGSPSFSPWTGGDVPAASAQLPQQATRSQTAPPDAMEPAAHFQQRHYQLQQPQQQLQQEQHHQQQPPLHHVQPPGRL
ncbi:hypothetical protein FNF27_03676 [Cafeteria roenbergensis]|uniref:BZIP domain-containing protein n=2 Tax=Cafeteria roenbergensis TaxID=33653 RepID=A0A5A8EB69_CAFRO|nr:hypothetical protein FNF27_03676 [Cafeteria roenbergensis]